MFSSISPKRDFHNPMAISSVVMVSFFIICTSILYGVYSNLGSEFTVFQALKSLLNYDEKYIESIILHTSVYPRILVVLMSGALLSLSGCIVQNIFKNNLLSPSTLGINSGIYLAVSVVSTIGTVSSLFLKSLIGTLSGILTMLVVFLMSKGKSNPLRLILSGITLSILLSSLTSAILRFYNKWSHEAFSWASGNLNQDSWEGAKFIFLTNIPFLIVLFFFIKKMEILSLGDDVAHNLGLSVNRDRYIILGIIAVINSTVITVVGLISFLGFIVPNLLKFLKMTSIKQRLLMNMFVGASLFLLTDTFVIFLNEKFVFNIFTGSFISLIGATLLFSLIVFNKNLGNINKKIDLNLLLSTSKTRKTKRFTYFSLLAIFCVSIFSIFFGYIDFNLRDFFNFFIRFDGNIILDIRTARFLGTILVGFVLGLSGSLIQSVIRNPVSSPEILGISSMSSLFMVIAMLMHFSSKTELSRSDFILISSLGSFAGIVLLLFFVKKHNFSTDVIPLIGISISSIAIALISLVSDFNVPWHIRTAITSWLSGSFYGLLMNQIQWFILLAPLLIIPIFAFNYYRDSFDLGELTMYSLGMPIKCIKLIILILVSLAIGYSTTLVGPMSFIGLITPHIARINGGIRGRGHLLMSGLYGSGLLSLGDFLGQKIAFPNELPASLVISSIILPYFVYLMYRVDRTTS